MLGAIKPQIKVEIVVAKAKALEHRSHETDGCRPRCCHYFPGENSLRLIPTVSRASVSRIWQALWSIGGVVDVVQNASSRQGDNTIADPAHGFPCCSRAFQHRTHIGRRRRAPDRTAIDQHGIQRRNVDIGHCKLRCNAEPARRHDLFAIGRREECLDAIVAARCRVEQGGFPIGLVGGQNGHDSGHGINPQNCCPKALPRV